MRITVYYFVRENEHAPAEEYIQTIKELRQIAAIQAVVEKLTVSGGRLPRPYAAHVTGKIWELRTRFGNRIFYFIHHGPAIILLYGYTKKRDRIENRVLVKIQNLYEEYTLTNKRKPF